jgi:hypothetical protein
MKRVLNTEHTQIGHLFTSPPIFFCNFFCFSVAACLLLSTCGIQLLLFWCGSRFLWTFCKCLKNCLKILSSQKRGDSRGVPIVRLDFVHDRRYFFGTLKGLNFYFKFHKNGVGKLLRFCTYKLATC